MRNNICVLILTNKDNTLAIDSYCFVDLINNAILPIRSSKSPNTFYNHCCFTEVGTIVCNCKPNTVRKFIRDNNLKFSDNKSIVQLLDFVGLNKFKFLSVSKFIAIQQMRLSHVNIERYKNGYNKAKSVANYLFYWKEHNITGLRAFYDFIGDALSLLKYGSESMSKSIYDFITNVCSENKIDISNFSYKNVLNLCGSTPILLKVVFNKDEKFKVSCITAYQNLMIKELIMSIDNPTYIELYLIFVLSRLASVQTNIPSGELKCFCKTNSIPLITDNISFISSTAERVNSRMASLEAMLNSVK